jgi:hypothetical protein
MKQRPNISIQKKSNNQLDYLRYLATENIQPNISQPVATKPQSKTKSKPIVNVQKRDIGKVNDFRIQMMNFANNELGIHPDLLIEEMDKYVLTITSYKILSGVETLTAKDFDIYCNGLRLDVETYSVNVGQNIVITIQKSEAVDGIVGQDFAETSFEIVSKFDPILLGVGDVDGDGEEDWLITENGKDIIK